MLFAISLYFYTPFILSLSSLCFRPVRFSLRADFVFGRTVFYEEDVDFDF